MPLASTFAGGSARGFGGLRTYAPAIPAGTVFRFDTSTTSTLVGNYYLIIIGGGTAGQNGLQNAGNYSSTQAGAGGASGFVYKPASAVALTGGETVTIGAGGNRGNNNLAGGNAGGHSSIGNYSSSSGNQVGGGGPATNNNQPRNGAPGSAIGGSWGIPTILTNEYGLSNNSTTGSGGGGGWNYAVGGSGGEGGGSYVSSPLAAIGKGGGFSGGSGGEPFNANQPHINGAGYGAGGGGGQGGGNGNNYVPPGGAGSQGVIYAIKA